MIVFTPGFWTGGSSGQNTTGTTGDGSAPATQDSTTVEPSTQSGTADNSGSDTGSSAEQQSSQQQAAAYASSAKPASTLVPSRAEPQSVFEARKLSYDIADGDVLERARLDAIEQQREQRTQLLIEGIAPEVAEDDAGLESRKKDPYELPDPIPVSEFLKRMKSVSAATIPAQ